MKRVSEKNLGKTNGKLGKLSSSQRGIVIVDLNHCSLVELDFFGVCVFPFLPLHSEQACVFPFIVLVPKRGFITLQKSVEYFNVFSVPHIRNYFDSPFLGGFCRMHNDSGVES